MCLFLFFIDLFFKIELLNNAFVLILLLLLFNDIQRIVFFFNSEGCSICMCRNGHARQCQIIRGCNVNDGGIAQYDDDISDEGI